MQTTARPAAQPAPSPIRVGIHDEPEVITLGLDGMLGRHRDRVRMSPDPVAVGDRVDVLICDPIGRSVGIERYLRSLSALTSARLLVFTWKLEAASIHRALAAGAHGFVPKSATSAELVAGIEAVHRGEAACHAATRELFDTAAPSPLLSTREAEVLGLICRGLSNLEIAGHLYVSVNSVKTYIRQVYQKIGVTRRAQAVAWGIDRGY